MHHRYLLPGLALLALSPCASASEDEAKQRRYGQHLARECTACHRVDGVDNGIPSIVGWDAATFTATLDFYRTGARTNAAMASVAQSLDDGQIKALALYFGHLPKPAAKKAGKK